MNRQSLTKCFLSFLLVFLAGCSLRNTGNAPDSFAKKMVSYSYINVSSQIEKNLLHTKLIYQFTDSGTYVSYLENGTEYEFGDFSYRKSDPDQAHLVLTYFANHEIFSYVFRMHFKTKTSGTWVALKSDDPAVTEPENGTFELISQNRFNQLTKKTTN